jgi:3-oxoacyl-[acyl-carrier-protein] synthase-3
MRSTIVGTGIYLPDTVVDNHALARIMDTSDEWIRKRTGIVERRFADPDSATSDVALPAAQAAIEDAGMGLDDIDYVVLATMTPDMYFPGSAPFLQRKMGLSGVPCLDIRQQCTGFLYGLQLADAIIRSGQYGNVLVVGAEVHACFMPWKSWDVLRGEKVGPVPPEEYAVNTATRDRSVIFGDGAGAVVVTSTTEGNRGILDILLRTDGNEAEKLCTRAGGSAYRPYFDPGMTASGDVTPFVEGREVYRLAVRLMPQVVEEILERNGLSLEDVSLVIMHQANLRINEAVQQRLGLSDEKVFNNIERYGNTTAGTIPIALHEARQAGRIQPGDLICLVGLGSGLNWGAVLYRW